MNYQSNRLILREFQPDDYNLFHSVFANEQVMQYALMERITAEEPMMAYFTKVLFNNNTKQDRRVFEFAVVLATDQRFIGFADIEIRNYNSKMSNGEIGYFLLPRYWGKGYATEIANKLIDICFSELKLHKVIASCNANNTSSEKVMQKTGMTKEGEFRKERFKNGQWDDELRYGILREEWEAKVVETAENNGGL